MRWEIISTEIQAHERSTNQRKRIEVLILWIYACALKLYPAAFRAAFMDEMLDVFAMTLREASGRLGWIILVYRELCDLPINIFRVRQQQAIAQAGSIKVWRARQVARWSSTTLSLFMLHNLLRTFSQPQSLLGDRSGMSMFYGLLVCTSVSMLLAWRWERMGGLLTVGGGVALGSFLIGYIGYFQPVEVSFIGLMLIGILWALPFVVFGALFYQLNLYTRRRKLTVYVLCTHDHF